MSPLDIRSLLGGHSPMFLQVSVAEDKRFELLRGLHPNTLSNNADQRSPASATVRDLPEHDRGGHRRTVADGGE
jgi:hypothetical protein